MKSLNQIFIESTSSREFVKNSFLELKRQHRNFTLAVFAQKAGFKSRSYPHLLLTGRRTVNLKNCDQISTALNLSHELAAAFRTQIQLEKTPGREQLIEQLNQWKNQFLSSEDKSQTG